MSLGSVTGAAGGFVLGQFARSCLRLPSIFLRVNLFGEISIGSCLATRCFRGCTGDRAGRNSQCEKQLDRF